MAAIRKAGSDPVTVCVPVYNAADFVERTLDAIARQSHRNFRVLVSVDLSDDDSAECCQRYAADPRFTVIVQDRRLRWIDNINSLIDQVESDDYCVIPHDDLIEPDYLTCLQATLDGNPDAAVAFSDITAYGELEGGVRQNSIEGAVFDRVVDFLTDHFDAVAFRGLVRRSRAGEDWRLRKNPFSSFGADTLWMLQILKAGTLIRVPKQENAGYRKYYRIGSQHHRWLRWSREVRTEAWMAHCVQCANYALSMPFDTTQQRLIVYAVLQRAIKRFKPMGWRPFLTDLTEAHRTLIQGSVAARIAGIGDGVRELDSMAQLRALPQYARLSARLWGEPDIDPVGQADPKFLPGATGPR